MITMKVKLDERKWREYRRKIIEQASHGARARVGILASKGGSEKHPGSDLSMVEIGAVHEFGSPAAHVPQRSFIRSTFADPRPMQPIAKRLSRALLAGSLSLHAALELLGQWGAAQVKKHMAAGDPAWPPLAPSTIAKRQRVQKSKRGADKPLIDTGRLRQSINYEVSEGGE